jgi:hypothetical protein
VLGPMIGVGKGIGTVVGLLIGTGVRICRNTRHITLTEHTGHNTDPASISTLR